MTNMRHKPVDARRSRRRRYIDAIEPFRKQFNCTAAEVHGIINNIMRDNEKLTRQVKDKDAEIAELKVKLVEMEKVEE